MGFNNDYLYDGMVILNRQLPVYSGEKIYGFYINLNDELIITKDKKRGNRISSYVNYLLSVSQFIKGGGDIDEDNNEWRLESEKIKITTNPGLRIFLDVMMDGFIGYKVVKIDEPVKDIEDNLITDKTVVDKYRSSEPVEIGGEQ